MFEEYDRLLSFKSVHFAIKAERLLLKATIDVVAMPTPREIDISCGQCLIYKACDDQAVRQLLSDAEVKWSRLYSRSANDRIYEQLAEYGQITGT